MGSREGGEGEGGKKDGRKERKGKKRKKKGGSEGGREGEREAGGRPVIFGRICQNGGEPWWLRWGPSELLFPASLLGWEGKGWPEALWIWTVQYSGH